METKKINRPKQFTELNKTTLVRWWKMLNIWKMPEEFDLPLKMSEKDYRIYVKGAMSVVNSLVSFKNGKFYLK